jgi:hypothetical protein
LLGGSWFYLVIFLSRPLRSITAVAQLLLDVLGTLPGVDQQGGIGVPEGMDADLPEAGPTKDAFEGPATPDARGGDRAVLIPEEEAARFLAQPRRLPKIVRRKL